MYIDGKCCSDFRVVSLCMSPINDSFMSGSLDGSVRLWDLRVNACQVRFQFTKSLRLPYGISLNVLEFFNWENWATLSDSNVRLLFQIQNFSRAHTSCLESL